MLKGSTVFQEGGHLSERVSIFLLPPLAKVGQFWGVEIKTEELGFFLGKILRSIFLRCAFVSSFAEILISNPFYSQTRSSNDLRISALGSISSSRNGSEGGGILSELSLN